MPTTNRSLLLDLQHGHAQQRWQEFVEVYRPLIAHAVRGTGIPDQDRDDVVQSVLLQLVKVLPQFSYQRTKGFFRGWLRRVTKNQAMDWQRKAGRNGAVLIDSEALSEVSTPEENHQQFDRELLVAALKSVRCEFRPKTWDCFHDRVLKEKSAALISQERGLSENAVYINTGRVLARLREFCILHGEELPDDHRLRLLYSRQ